MALEKSRLIPLAAAAVAVGASSAVQVGRFTNALVEVSGISGDVITMQARLTPGGGFYAIGVTNISGSTLSGTINADGIYRLTIDGLADVRSNITTYSAGSLNINIRFTDK